ncbi:hypothetical protein [Candidatus Poriferisocius sp.]|uniref:hypothetical protein n=1 Tax=Candidatus Poriferisocius sp. TaxID=3101276 RepID=UPI003B011DF9
MTDKVKQQRQLAVRPQQNVQVHRPEPMWPANLDEAMKMGELACQLLGKDDKEQGKMAGIILSGLELGIGPMTAARGIWIVEGQPYVSANLQRAIILASPVCRSLTVKPVMVPVVDKDGQRTGATEPGAVATGVRADNGDAMKVVVRESQYAHMKKTRTGKDNLAWKQNLADMLVARATGKLARGLFADVLFGMGVADVRQRDGGEEVVEVEPIESDEGAFVGAGTIDPDEKEWEEAQKRAAEADRQARDGAVGAAEPPWGLE